MHACSAPLHTSQIVRRLSIGGVRVVVVRDLDGCGPVRAGNTLLVEDQGDDAMTDAVARAALGLYDFSSDPS